MGSSMGLFDIKFAYEIELSDPDIYDVADKYIITRIDFSLLKVETHWIVGDELTPENSEDYYNIKKMTWKMRNSRTQNVRLQENLKHFYGYKIS
jgi:hypothetical protein